MSKLYQTLMALFTTATMACAGDRFTPKEVESKYAHHLGCSLEYVWQEEDGQLEKKKEFAFNCQVNERVRNCMDTSPSDRILPNCNFPSADENYVQKGILPREIAKYKGNNALQRAKADFDACGIEGIIFDGGWWDAEVIAGQYPIADAVSPFTLKRLTESELNQVDSIFNCQAVAALREDYDGRTSRLPDSYFQ